jgi:hypothetical protein
MCNRAQADRLPKPKRKSSAVSSGRKLFVQGTGNSPWARRYRDLIGQHAADAGGADLLSEAQLSLIRRAAALECELEQREGELSLGREIDLDAFQRAANSLRRLLESIGLKRVAKTIENPIVAEFNRKEAIRLALYANMPEPDYSVSDFKEGSSQP